MIDLDGECVLSVMCDMFIVMLVVRLSVMLVICIGVCVWISVRKIVIGYIDVDSIVWLLNLVKFYV